MTADNFVHWLQGFFDCMDGKPLLPADVAKIQMKMADIDSKPGQHVSWPPGVGIRGLGMASGGVVSTPFVARAGDNVQLCSSGASGSLAASGSITTDATTSRGVAP